MPYKKDRECCAVRGHLLEHRLRCEHGAVHFEHLFLKHKMAPPEVEQLSLHGTAHGAKVKLASNTCVTTVREF